MAALVAEDMVEAAKEAVVEDTEAAAKVTILLLVLLCYHSSYSHGHCS